MKSFLSHNSILKAVLIAVAVAGFSRLAVSQERVPEPLIKTALVFNISKFAQWPNGVFSDSRDPILACVAGTGAFAEAFVAIEGRTISDRRIDVKRVESPAEFQSCHILVIPSEGFAVVGRHLRKLANRPILMFSDHPGFAQRHGAIEIISKDQRIGFKVNIDRLARTRINLSSKVLNLAREILREDREN